VNLGTSEVKNMMTKTPMTKNLDAEKYLVKTEYGPLKLMPLIKEKLGLK